MPVDYSKWDAIELSDDDDFECHPNVDKASMVRWKQAQVHQKRRERQDKMAALGRELELSESVVKSLKELLQGLDSGDLTKDALSTRLAELRDKTNDGTKDLEEGVFALVMADRDPRWEAPGPDPFFQARLDVTGLVIEILERVPKSDENSLKDSIKEVLAKIESREALVHEELAKEELAISSKITSETMKTGFDRTILAKSPAAAAAAEKTGVQKKTEKVIETIHSPSSSSDSPSATDNPKSEEEEEEDDEDADYITSEPAKTFAYLSGPLKESMAFLSKHPEIVSQKYADEVLAEAFRLELEHRSKEAKQCVHQSLILQYCGILGAGGIGMFFKRMEAEAPRARDMFAKDLNETYTRIARRVKEIAADKLAEEEREIQEGLARVAAATQPDGTLALPIGPDGEGADRAAVFATFPQSFQEAILLQDVDKINAFLATLNKEEAEKTVSEAARVGLLTLQVEGEEEEPASE